jgi:hexosaminidase
MGNYRGDMGLKSRNKFRLYENYLTALPLPRTCVSIPQRVICLLLRNSYWNTSLMPTNQPVLLPLPQRLTRPSRRDIGYRNIHFTLPTEWTRLLTYTRHLSRAVARLRLPKGPRLDVRMELSVCSLPAPTEELSRQAYQLTIAPGGISLTASTEVGAYYGLQTLVQLLRNTPGRLPELTINDWPALPRRGFYYDVARGKVPKLKTLLQLIDDLAALKINEFQLYMENAFTFPGHPEISATTTPLTAEDIRQLDDYCQQRFIDFVPSLTSLGHFDKILRLPKYRPLAEIEPADLPAKGITPWCSDPWTLCVTDPAAQQLLADMYAGYLPHFRSSQCNICCDESWDLGQGRSSARTAEIGIGKLYVDWVRYCGQLAGQYGKTIQMWGDIIRNHPELIVELPAGTVLLEWGYEVDHDFDANLRQYRDAQRPVYACPGTSSWMTFGTRGQVWRDNIAHAATAAVKYNARGLLNTDWGDHGHQQFWAVSMLPMAWGAALSWNAARPEWPEFITAVDAHIFQSYSGSIAQQAWQLAQVWEQIGVLRKNAGVDFWLFREAWADWTWLGRCAVTTLQSALHSVQQCRKQIMSLRSQRSDAPLLLGELLLTARQLEYTLERSILRMEFARDPRTLSADTARAMAQRTHDLAHEFARLWRQRNQESRLQDILHHFHQHAAEWLALS